MDEIWKDVPEYEGIYQASNLGNIKSLNRETIMETKNQHCKFKCKKIIKEKILKPKLTKDGYYELTLRKDGKQKFIRVHRLIAMTFIPNPNNYPVINHINHNRLDNRVENLEWCTVEYNNRYSSAKKIIQLDKNYKIIKIWKCMSDVHRELGIPVTNLSKCCRRHNLTARNCYWRYYDEEII